MNTSVEVELYTQRAAQSCELTKEKKKKKMTAGFFKTSFSFDYSEWKVLWCRFAHDLSATCGSLAAVVFPHQVWWYLIKSERWNPVSGVALVSENPCNHMWKHLCVCDFDTVHFSRECAFLFIYIYFFKVAVTDIVYASSLRYVCLQMTICFTFRAGEVERVVRHKWNG